jgi:formamidopyrimidine-DNA glycosylase
MLHVARIHPAKVCSQLSARKLRLLYEAMRRILLTAIKYEGSTLADGTYRNALNDPGSYQNQHLVYNRAGLPCPTCGKACIRRMVQAQRATFYCPRCQRS